MDHQEQLAPLSTVTEKLENDSLSNPTDIRDSRTNGSVKRRSVCSENRRRDDSDITHLLTKHALAECLDVDDDVR
jgi:hypothetical protein